MPGVPRPEYPRPQLRRREWINLNGGWRFGFDRPDFDRSILVPFAYQSDLSGIGERSLHDTVWYSRVFEAPAAESLVLHFGAVDYEATVWLNDVQVIHHEGGHTPFSADITGMVRPGANTLVVRADDPAADRTLPRGKQFWGERPQGIFYTPTTGIWQTVWLEPLPRRAITSLRLWPRLKEGALEFELETSESAPEADVEVRIAGRKAGAWKGEPGLGRILLDEVSAWSPQSPVLYDVTVRLIDDAGRQLDRVDSYFGMRTVETAGGQILLNGEPCVQRLVLDQGYYPGGWYTAASDDDLRRDIVMAKMLGFNGARKHQKLEDPRWLFWADQLGFMVWEEMPGFQEYSPAAERRLVNELDAAIRRDRDHPCVVAWVPSNESFGLESPLSAAARVDLLLRLYRLAHELDGTRPVSSNDGWQHAITDLCTVHDYGGPAELRRRYASLPAALRADDRPRLLYLDGFNHRGEPLVVSEFGGLALAGSGGFGWSEVANSEELVLRYGELLAALMAPGPVEGFCYTQLTDIELECNGLLTFERRPKVDPSVISPLTQTPKRRS